MLMADMLSPEFGQACGRDRLSMSLVLLVWSVELDALGKLREFSSHHFTSFLKKDSAAFSAGHATENEEVPHIVEIGTVRDEVPEADANSLVNAARPLIA